MKLLVKQILIIVNINIILLIIFKQKNIDYINKVLIDLKV